jgi:hypothetical protein
MLELTVNGYPAGDLKHEDDLDDFTLYWLMNTAVSTARFYWENHINLYDAADVSVPAKTIKHHEAGRSGHITSSSISTKSTKAGTTRRGSSLEPFATELRAVFRSLQQPA